VVSSGVGASEQADERRLRCRRPRRGRDGEPDVWCAPRHRGRV